MEGLKIEEVIEKDGMFVSTIVGVSMYPMLRNRRDTIVVMPYEGRLKKYDVPLYKVGDKYILHRIIEVLPDSYVIRGDNCVNKEYGITDEHILGVLTSFHRDGKEVNMSGFGYKTYVFVWCHTFYIRLLWKKMFALLVRILRKPYRMIFKRGAK